MVTASRFLTEQETQMESSQSTKETGSKIKNQAMVRQFSQMVLFIKEDSLKTCLMDRGSMSGLTGMFTREVGKTPTWKERVLSSTQMAESTRELLEEITF